MAKTEITTNGIKKHIKGFPIEKAISEYIWNGFDAGAERVQIDYELNELGGIDSLKIADNGQGIAKDKLKEKFKPFFDSHKIALKNKTLPHGKNGYGRFSFIQFALKAVWETTYENSQKNTLETYKIEININDLTDYKPEDIQTERLNEKGTSVSFYGIKEIEKFFLENELKNYLKKEFSWFLESNKTKKLLINGEPLFYEDIILDSEDFKIIHPDTKTVFTLRFIQWKDKLHEEYSKFYYFGATNEELWKENTKLNNQGDAFHHSLYIKSEYFDHFDFDKNAEDKGVSLIGTNRKTDSFEFLQREIYSYLKGKRYPYVQALAEKLINEYEKEGILKTEDAEDELEELKRGQLDDLIRKLYIVNPKLFNKLNLEQKKIFTGLLEGLLDTNERDTLLGIIGKVLELTPKEREEFADILENSSLTNILKTLKVIEGRYITYYELRELITNKFINAEEADIQKTIENNTWLFGEQYHLVSAAEPKFEEALRRYKYILEGIDEKTSITHPNKNKEMDIFACRQRIVDNYQKIENLILELKHPDISLGKEELEQVEKYMRVIKNTAEFNNNSKWTFILIGNQLKVHKGEKTAYIQDKIDALEGQAKPYLAMLDKNLNYEVYVKTWSQIFDEFTIKHEFLNKELNLRKDNLISKSKTADEAVEKATGNAAALKQKNWLDKFEPVFN